MTPTFSPILVEHFKSENKDVTALLEAGSVAMHSFIVAEMALGGLRDRMMTLASLEFLPVAGRRPSRVHA